MLEKNIWLIGAGQMAIEYAKVISALGCSYTTIGRGKKNCDIFFNVTGKQPVLGGLDLYLNSNPTPTDTAIVAVGTEALASTTKQLLSYGIKFILLEKPGVGDMDEIYELCELAKQKGATVLLAYNRRFYSSIQNAKKLIEIDGGISSFQFEFTEWSHKISKLQKHPVELKNWFLGNSTHVIDTAFYLGGKPVEIKSFTSGGVEWHPASSIFAGAGVSDKGALFSYNANWEAPGRWAIEMLTKKRRYIFKPLEKLQIQEIGSLEIRLVDIDDNIDLIFKPGLYMQTKAFLGKDFSNFCDIHLQANMISNVYKGMSKY